MPDMSGGGTLKAYEVIRWRCSFCHEIYHTREEAIKCHDSHHPTTFEAEKGMWDQNE